MRTHMRVCTKCTSILFLLQSCVLHVRAKKCWNQIRLHVRFHLEEPEIKLQNRSSKVTITHLCIPVPGNRICSVGLAYKHSLQNYEVWINYQENKNKFYKDFIYDILESVELDRWSNMQVDDQDKMHVQCVQKQIPCTRWLIDTNSRLYTYR
jgi:hypothetical protein